MSEKFSAVRDELGFVLCHHGRPIQCDECGAEYELEIAPKPSPHSREAGAQQGPRLSTHGHRFGKPYDDGYAVCQRCGTREDSKIAGKPCLGPRSERPPASREAEIAARLLAEAFALREGKSELTVDETADLLTEASDLLAQLQQARQERDVAQKAVSYSSEQAHLEWTRAEQVETSLRQAREALKELPNQIMNLPHGISERTETADAYKRGFRDARHAAAELVCGLDAALKDEGR